MKFICVRPIKLEKEYFIQNQFVNDSIKWEKYAFIEPRTYNVRCRKYDFVIICNAHIRIDSDDNIKIVDLLIDKNALIDDGYFEGNFIDKLFHKEAIKKLNKKDLYFSNSQKQKVINEAKKVLSEASQKALEELPIWMKCNIILKYLRDHFIETNEDLDENQLKWINKILKHPCKWYNEFDFNIFEEIHNLDELKELQYASNAAEYDNGPKRKEICKRCGDAFYLTKSELDWYCSRDLNVPKKYPYCRKAIEIPVMIYSENENFNESIEEEPVKTEMQIALEKAGMSITEQK